MGFRTDPQQLGLWLPLVGVLALELGAAFSVVLVRSVNSGGVAQVAHARPTDDSVAHEQSPAVEDRKPAHRPTATGVAPPKPKRAPRRRDHDDDDQAPRKRGLSGLLDAVQASGGKVVNLSQRKLARQIGVSRRTLERAMGDLADAGAVMLDTSRAGTRLALA
jgi:hypothetical protein